MILNDLPRVQPVVQAIEAPSLLRNYRLGTVVALRHGKGALVATSLDVRAPRPEARQLRQSLINYLARGVFDDAAVVTRAEAAGLFNHPRHGTVSAPTGEVVLDVKAAANAHEEGFKPWKPSEDGVVQCADGFGYRFEQTDTRWESARRAMRWCGKGIRCGRGR